MRPGEPILIISHTFPPYKGIGGRRWAKFAKALAKRGYAVHVIHSAGGEELKGSLWNEDVVHPNIITHPLPQRYPTVLFKRPLRSIADKVMYRVWQRVLPLMTEGNWLDKAVRWRTQLLAKAGELIEAQGIRNVIVTGAPFGLMTHAAELKKHFPHIHLVADFRDPWTWGHYYGQRLLSAKKQGQEQEQEAQVARVFDKLISPAPAIIEHLRKTYGGDASRIVHVPHAIDPDELKNGSNSPLPGRGAGGEVFRMIYAGSLYGAEEAEAYFEQLLRAFENLHATRSEAFGRSLLDLYITGHDTSAYQQKVAARGLSERIRFHAPVPAREIFPKIAAADLVLIFIPSPNKDFLGTKFTEIFYLRKPVLHIGVPGFVSESIVGRKLGASVTVAQLAEELPRIMSGERVIDIDPHVDLSEHLLDAITEKLIREVLV